MRRSPLVRPLLIIGSLAALGATLMAGCSGNHSAPTGPASSADLSTGRTYSAKDPQFAAAIRVQDKVTPTLLAKQGVIGTGVSADAQGRPVIVIYTERAIGGLPSLIEGHSTRIVVTGTVVPYAPPGGGPVQMGTSTGNDRECSAGTFGCVVVKGGSDYFLSNNHVFARENAASNGERIDAPGRYDAHPKCAQTPQAATLSDFQPISFGGNNTIDAAIASPVSGFSYTQVEAGGYDPSSTVVSPAVGLAVKKTGRTSGLTHGTIGAINVTIQVQYSGGIARFVSQIQVGGNFIRSGDSGSLMVTETGNNPVGLCFAGGGGASFANPIGPVLQRFSATVK